MSVTPFVVGQWVKGKKFYGRGDLITEILDGPRNWLWLAGRRRVGKTSLLKQVEHLTGNDDTRRFFPMFWDFQAASTTVELHRSFAEYLEDTDDRLQDLDIDIDDVLDEDDLFGSLRKLRRKLRAKDRKLLLLCDEVEKLIELNEENSDLLSKLREAFMRYEDVHTVMAATIRLWNLAEQTGEASPFMHGISPLYIQTLKDEEAEALIRQANLPDASRPAIDDDDVKLIRLRCDNHPFLIQLLCKRFLDVGNLDEATQQVAADPMVNFFFSVDFDMLSDVEKDILRIIAEQDSSTSNSIQVHLTAESAGLSAGLHQLENLGHIRRDARQRFVLINYFFKKWFMDNPQLAAVTPPETTAVDSKPGSVPADADSAVASNVTLGEFDGRYEMLARVGEGATGVVFKAHDKLLRADAAIKLLKPQYAANEEALERLRREIVLSRDINHPNVVNIYHLGQYKNWKYLTMKWMEGRTLGAEIKAAGPFPVARVAFITQKLAGALDAAHACRVLHRDVKPQNILMDEHGAPHLTDFGLARIIDEPGMTMAGFFVGTPNYASPEQGAAKELDERSDLYSLGVVMYEMATGQRPFRGKSSSEVLQMHQSTPPRQPRELRGELPKGLAAVILRCLEKKPARRFQSAGELGEAVGEWV